MALNLSDQQFESNLLPFEPFIYPNLELSNNCLKFNFPTKSCKLLEPLIIYDPAEQHGSEYLICLNGEAKYGYLQSEEDANLALVDSSTAYEYRPPSPQLWGGLQSDKEIERDWVVDSRPKVSSLVATGLGSIHLDTLETSLF